MYSTKKINGKPVYGNETNMCQTTVKLNTFFIVGVVIDNLTSGSENKINLYNTGIIEFNAGRYVVGEGSLHLTLQ